MFIEVIDVVNMSAISDGWQDIYIPYGIHEMIGFAMMGGVRYIYHEG